MGQDRVVSKESMISVRETDFQEIKDEWMALEKEGHIPTVFQTYDWMETWWKHLGFRGRKLILAAYEDKELIGIAPLYISKLIVKGVPIFNVVRLIGAGESDYQAFILKGGREEIGLKALLAHLKDLKWDIFWLSDVYPESATNFVISGVLKAAGFHYLSQQHTPCPYIVLPRTFEEYKKVLSKSVGRNLSYYCNKIERQAGFRFGKVSNSEISSGMEILFNLHSDRWRRAGEEGALSETAVRNFHVEASHRLSQYLDLKQLKLNGRVIATTYSYDFNGKRCFYLPGMDMDYQDFRLGTVMMAKGIKDAIECGLREFDFMRGDEEYKLHFTKTMRHNMRYFFAKHSFKFKAFCRLERIS